MRDTLKLKNYQLQFLAKMVEYKVPMEWARARRRFYEHLYAKLRDTENKRIEICERLCIKNADGKPELKDGKFDFKPEDLATMNMEYAKMMGEEAEFNANEIGQDDITIVNRIFQNSQIEVDDRDLEMCDQIANAFTELFKKEEKVLTPSKESAKNKK